MYRKFRPDSLCICHAVISINLLNFYHIRNIHTILETSDAISDSPKQYLNNSVIQVNWLQAALWVILLLSRYPNLPNTDIAPPNCENGWIIGDGLYNLSQN